MSVLIKLALISLCVSFITAMEPIIPPPPEEYQPDDYYVEFYKGQDGGDIICYSHCADTSLYSVGNDIYVNGRIRLQGTYRQGDGVFEPKGWEGQDISAVNCFKFMCNMAFSGCQNGCWAGGDTGAPSEDCNC